MWTGAFLPLLPTCQAISYLGNFSSTTLVITTTERTVFKGRFGWLESPPSSQDCNFTWETFSHKSALERQSFFFFAAFRSFFSLSVCHYQKKSFRNASMSKLMNFSLMHRKASPGIEQQTLLNCNFYALFKWDNLHLIRIFLPRANIALL